MRRARRRARYLTSVVGHLFGDWCTGIAFRPRHGIWAIVRGDIRANVLFSSVIPEIKDTRRRQSCRCRATRNRGGCGSWDAIGLVVTTVPPTRSAQTSPPTPPVPSGSAASAVSAASSPGNTPPSHPAAPRSAHAGGASRRNAASLRLGMGIGGGSRGCVGGLADRRPGRATVR